MADMSYQVFVALDATALEGGSIYLGVANDDPELNPISVYWDEALTVLAEQPLRTSGGVIVRDGTPADIYSPVAAYSIRVRDRSGQVVWYKPTTGGGETSRLTFPIPTGPEGPMGPAGAANSSYATLAQFKAADITNLTANYDGDLWFFTTGDYTGKADDRLIVKADSTPLSEGAWVRSVSTYVTPEQFGAKGDSGRYEFGGGGTDDTDALARAAACGKSVWLAGSYLTRGAQRNNDDTYSGCKFISDGVTWDGPGRIIKMRGVDGIPVYVEGEDVTLRTITLQGFNGSFTGTIALTTGSITASISGYTLTVTAGTVTMGTFLNLAGLGWFAFITGANNDGTYTVAMSQPRTIASTTFGTRLSTLSASNVVGTIRTVPSGGYGSMLSADGVSTRTMIIAQLSGPAGGAGTYALNTPSTSPSAIMRFTDAPTLNLFNDMVRVKGARLTVDDVLVDGSGGNGIQNFGSPFLTIRGKTRIVGCLDNCTINANAGADDFSVGDDVEMRGSGRQNLLFCTANAASQPTTDRISRITIGSVTLEDAGDTPLEIGQHCYDVKITRPTLGPGVNPLFLQRDANNVKLISPIFVLPPLAEQRPEFSVVAVIPYYEGPTWQSGLVIDGPVAKGPAMRGFGYYEQSGITVLNARGINTNADPATGNGQTGAFATMGAGTSNFYFSGNQAIGFVANYLFNPTGGPGGSVEGFISENNEYENFNEHISAFQTTFRRSRSADTLRAVKQRIYGLVGATSQPVLAVPGLTCADAIVPDGLTGSVPAIFAPEDAPQKGFAGRRGTLELTLPETQYAVTGIVPLASLGNKTGYLVITDGSGDITVSVSVASATTVKINGSTNLFATQGSGDFSGWAVYAASGYLILQRRGSDTGMSGRSFQWSTT